MDPAGVRRSSRIQHSPAKAGSASVAGNAQQKKPIKTTSKSQRSGRSAAAQENALGGAGKVVNLKHNILSNAGHGQGSRVARKPGVIYTSPAPEDADEDISDKDFLNKLTEEARQEMEESQLDGSFEDPNGTMPFTQFTRDEDDDDQAVAPGERARRALRGDNDDNEGEKEGQRVIEGAFGEPYLVGTRTLRVKPGVEPENWMRRAVIRDDDDDDDDERHFGDVGESPNASKWYAKRSGRPNQAADSAPVRYSSVPAISVTPHPPRRKPNSQQSSPIRHELSPLPAVNGKNKGKGRAMGQSEMTRLGGTVTPPGDWRAAQHGIARLSHDSFRRALATADHQQVERQQEARSSRPRFVSPAPVNTDYQRGERQRDVEPSRPRSPAPAAANNQQDERSRDAQSSRRRSPAPATANNQQVDRSRDAQPSRPRPPAPTAANNQRGERLRDAQSSRRPPVTTAANTQRGAQTPPRRPDSPTDPEVRRIGRKHTNNEEVDVQRQKKRRHKPTVAQLRVARVAQGEEEEDEDEEDANGALRVHGEKQAYHLTAYSNDPIYYVLVAARQSYMLFVLADNAWPDGEKKDDALECAWDAGVETHRKHYERSDQEYDANIRTMLLHAANSLRGRVGSAARDLVVGYYELQPPRFSQGSDDAKCRFIRNLVEQLLHENKFIKGMYHTRRGEEVEDVSFAHPCIREVIARVFFASKPSGIAVKRLDPIPGPLVAFAATAIQRALEEWESGTLKRTKFDEDNYREKYVTMRALWKKYAKNMTGRCYYIATEIFQYGMSMRGHSKPGASVDDETQQMLDDFEEFGLPMNLYNEDDEDDELPPGVEYDG